MTATEVHIPAPDAAQQPPPPQFQAVPRMQVAPQLQVTIHILDDGRVVFGDLPPALAEVARIVAGAALVPASEDSGFLEGAR